MHELISGVYSVIILRMKTWLARPIAVVLMFFVFIVQTWATCGGGGGGGMGGMKSSGGNSSTGMPDTQTYPVPWKLIKPEDPPLTSGLAVYWFPSSQTEIDKSSLRNSRTLSLYAQQCVTMGIVDFRTALGQKFISGGDKTPVAVVAQADGKLIAKVENKDGFLQVEAVEKALQTEIKQREETIKNKIKEAKDNVKAGDKDGAISLLRGVVDEKCLFPSRAKDAAKELKKLGVEVGQISDGPIFDPSRSKQIEATMERGLKAELDAKYTDAEKLYAQAHHMDPADATPMRYLGELYRHHLGDWEKARKVFDEILAMQADPISRAVALHGLGKMTIHEGEFKKGLALMESSTKEYPLALAYRNLAVYWNSEGDGAKADHYVQLALALDPHDPYNLIFAAASMGPDHAAEALKIAKDNEALLPASYNLAAIYAQLGQKDKAIELLKRHFFEYERYQSVRSKEMMEARVDAVFSSLFKDPTFIALTAGADGRLPLPAGYGMGVRQGGTR